MEPMEDDLKTEMLLEYEDPRPRNRKEKREYKKQHKGKTWEEVHHIFK